MGPDRKPEANGHGAEAGKQKWAKITDAARQATRDGILTWIGKAKGWGAVSGAALWRFKFRCDDVNFKDAIFHTVARAGASTLLAIGFADTVFDSWKSWADDYKCDYPAYPKLANWPSFIANNVDNLPFPLSLGKSFGFKMLQNPGHMAERIRAHLEGAIHEPAALQEIDQFARWYSGEFLKWHGTVMVTEVKARGEWIISRDHPNLPKSGPIFGEAKADEGFLRAYPFAGGVAPRRAQELLEKGSSQAQDFNRELKLRHQLQEAVRQGDSERAAQLMEAFKRGE